MGVQRDNGILITSSTIVHRDDEYDLDETKRSEFIVKGRPRSFVQPELQPTAESEKSGGIS